MKKLFAFFLKNRTAFAAVLTAAALLCALAGCGESPEPEKTEPEPEKTETGNTESEPEKTETGNTESEPEKTETGNTESEPVSESELALIKETVAAFERWDNDRLVCTLDYDAPENAEAFAALVKERGDNAVDTVLVTCCKTKEEARAHAARCLGADFKVPDDAMYEFGGRLYAFSGAKGYVEFKINDPSRVTRQSDGTVYVPVAWYGSGGEYGGEDVFIMRFEDGAYKITQHIAND